ncbi:halocyanin domain-containing protein [Haloprofundus salilacus]|uniref:halocyanin domain-containing protein n=1 Tax=Haloprofundus salilacus TaxID=2876190 RepID=UPI001CCB1EA4|nr:halocyanin domain-containing protein [Haloprofundus salilacus]
MDKRTTSKHNNSNQVTDSPPGQPSADRPTDHSIHRTACDRRRFLSAAGSLALVGLLGGCTNTANDGDSGSNGESDPASVDDWLSNTGNYEGVVDTTDVDSVTIEVGARGNNGANAFAPAAIEISPGTTVTWEWVDGYHNVVATEGQFDSGEVEQNATFEHTFDTTGTVYYYCEPHRSMAMKGAIVVSDGASGGSP